MDRTARREAGPVGPGRRWRLLALGIVLLSTFLSLRLTGLAPSASSLSESVEELGNLGIAVYVGLGVFLSCVFVPFPLIAGAAGAAFGVAVGTAVALAIVICAAVVQMSITRLAARLEDGPARYAHDKVLEQHGVATVFYTRLVPGLPYVPLNYAAGATRLTRRAMATGTALASAPRSFAYAALGGSLSDLGAPEAKAAIAVLVAMAIAGVLVSRRRGDAAWSHLAPRGALDRLRGRQRE